MRRIRLTAAEQAHLAQLFKTTNDRRLRDRCQAIVMAHRGRKRKTIAQDLGVHRTTVRLWLKQYDEQGVEGIQIHYVRTVDQALDIALPKAATSAVERAKGPVPPVGPAPIPPPVH